MRAIAAQVLVAAAILLADRAVAQVPVYGQCTYLPGRLGLGLGLIQLFPKVVDKPIPVCFCRTPCCSVVGLDLTLCFRVYDLRRWKYLRLL